MPKICKPKYLAQVKLLTKEETERLLCQTACNTFQIGGGNSVQ
ncbi:MAG: hypothetical protein FD173_1862 [Gallionellaceae bacterium]|nr:MAG: hypothetical protein FD173_1862 [Gallionellaceae bacterium]